MLGVFPDREFEEREVRLDSRDRVVLFTDGVSESWNATGEEFGDDRIVAAARGSYHDDVTTVVLTVKPNGSP